MIHSTTSQQKNLFTEQLGFRLLMTISLKDGSIFSLRSSDTCNDLGQLPVRQYRSSLEKYRYTHTKSTLPQNKTVHLYHHSLRYKDPTDQIKTYGKKTLHHLTIVTKPIALAKNMALSFLMATPQHHN